MRWATAGHDPVIVYDAERDQFSELSGGDVPLGIEPGVAYRELSREELTPGTVLVCGTDGIWEARNRAGEMFGKDRLREVVRATQLTAPAGSPPRSMRRSTASGRTASSATTSRT